MSIFATPYRIGEELVVTASDILDLPPNVHLRMVDSADGHPLRPHGYWPLIIKIWQERNDADHDYVYVVTADDPEGAFRLKPEDSITVIYGRMNLAQESALRDLAERYKVPFDPNAFAPTFDLPNGYVAGQVGSIYVGCDPEGRISS